MKIKVRKNARVFDRSFLAGEKYDVSAFYANPLLSHKIAISLEEKKKKKPGAKGKSKSKRDDGGDK